MPEKIAKHKPYLGLTDPAVFLRPLIFFTEVVRRHLAMIGLFSILLTALVLLGCALLPPVYNATAVIVVDWQAAPETMRVRLLLGKDEDEFMATQVTFLQAETILRPIAERYRLLERERQLPHYWFWHYSATKERAIRNGAVKLKHLRIEHDPKTYLLTITYWDRDPQIAADVANAVADSYLRNISEARIKEVGALNSSVEQQLNELKEHLESIDLALVAPQRAPLTANREERSNVPLSTPQLPQTPNRASEGNRVPNEAVYRKANYRSLPQHGNSDRWRDLIGNAKVPPVKANKAPADEPKQDVKAAQADSSDAVRETRQHVDDRNPRPFDYLKLKHESDAAEGVSGNLFAQIKLVGIRSDLHNFIRLADSARPAAAPIFPNWPLIVGLSMVFFALSCSAYTIWNELTDGTAKGVQAVEEALGIPVVCALPQVKDLYCRLALGPDGMRLAGNRWRSVQCGFFDEGVRHLRGYLMLSARAGKPRSVLVTSALPGEGKSTLALALATANAEQGKRTLLIDTDLRKPAIERLVRLSPGSGFGAVLGQSVQWSTATREVPSHPNLFVLGSGLPSLRELGLIGPQTRGILAEATKEYDLVVLDSPPLLGCAETLELAAAAEVTVLAVRSGRTPMKAIGAVVETLRRVEAPIAGIVLNESAHTTDALSKAYGSYYTVLSGA
jgi:polysaccharide biosynthesis transport protein